MKTLLQKASRLVLAAAFAGLGFTQPAQAQTANQAPAVSVLKVNDFTYIVRASNPQRQRSRLQVVRLSDNAVVYSQSTFKPTFGGRLNVQQLTDGEYAVVVKVGQGVTRYSLNLQTETERTVHLENVSLAAVNTK
jgi:hypothetical protein